MGNPIRWHNRPAEKADLSSPRHLPAAVRRPEETGFTLIEVVIAFSILGILFLVHPRISSLKVVNWPTSPTLGGQRCGAWSRWY